MRLRHLAMDTTSRHGARAHVFALILATLAACCLFAFAPASQAATPAPAWSLTVTAQPTNFARGEAPAAGAFGGAPQYNVTATNIGSGSTTEPITITDVLPTGLTAVGPAARQSAAATTKINCSVAGQTVTCIVSPTVSAGGWVQAVIPVEVADDAPTPVRNEATISDGGASSKSSATTTSVEGGIPEFGFLSGSAGLSAAVTGPDGGGEEQAGGHPYQFTLEMGFPSMSSGDVTGTVGGNITSAGHLRDLTVNLPQGMIVNPKASPVRCTEVQLEGEGCPNESQVGTVTLSSVVTSIIPVTRPLNNMVAVPGSPATLGFNAFGLNIFVHVSGGVRTDRKYELSASSHDILARFGNPVLNVNAQLWGDPSSSSHDPARGGSVAPSSTAFLTLPSACSSSLAVTASADSWENPKGKSSASAEVEDSTTGHPSGVSGCEALDFEPTLALKPEVNSAETPTGLHVDLHVPQHNGVDELATANLRDAKVTLPEGLAVNPSSAGGLAACDPQQIALHSGTRPQCPDASKIGTVSVKTPLLDDPLPGAVYVATPYDNPFESLLAIYVTIDDPQTGIVVKLAGEVSADGKKEGQLTTTFTEAPELPFEDFELDFFGGPRAALRTPSTCRSFSTQSELTPWSRPEPVHTSNSFVLEKGANGAGCAAEESQLPNAPTFEAGTQNPLAAAYSPFVLHLHREDGSQALEGLNVTLPPGLTGKLAGIPACPDTAIEAAKGKTGREEQSSPSCPQVSEVGKVTVGAGVGPSPYYVDGKAYLAGPYNNAPLSLVIITPAVAGPYDLGTVVTRVALHVDPETTQIHAISDPLPTILYGIPLDVRSIALKMDRPDFTLNPTSCDPLAITGTATSSLGQTIALNQRFQVGGCSALPFKPKLSLRLKGRVRRTAHPRLIATLRAKQGEANIARAQVKLPSAVFLDQGHIKTVCTRVQWAADTCPAGSVYGRAEATTPLLDYPISGSVYLRSSSHKLPDLLVKLKGPASQPIEIDLDGKTDSVKGALRNTFEAVPDAPVSTFRLELFGGKRGLIEMSSGFCSNRHAAVNLTGQNGKLHDTRPAVAAKCPKKHRRHHKKHKAHKQHTKHSKSQKGKHHHKNHHGTKSHKSKSSSLVRRLGSW